MVEMNTSTRNCEWCLQSKRKTSVHVSFKEPNPVTPNFYQLVSENLIIPVFPTLETTNSLLLKLFFWAHQEYTLSQTVLSVRLLERRPTGNHPPWAETHGKWLSQHIRSPPSEHDLLLHTSNCSHVQGGGCLRFLGRP